MPVLAGRYALLVRAPVELGSIRLVERRVLLAARRGAADRACCSATAARGCSRGGSGGSSVRPTASRTDASTSRSWTPAAGELGALAAAFERMRVRLAHLDDARREFVANASHELRTPLFSLAGFLELLDDEELDEATRREFLASMREQVDRLTKLASDLLDLSRLDSGRLTVECEPVDLARWRATWSRSSGRSRGLERPSTRRGDDREPGARRGRRAAGAPARPDPGRERAAAHAAGNAGRGAGARARRARGARGRGRRAGSARTSGSSCSSASSGSTARGRRAAASGWRSPGSSPS